MKNCNGNEDFLQQAHLLDTVRKKNEFEVAQQKLQKQKLKEKKELKKNNIQKYRVK